MIFPFIEFLGVAEERIFRPMIPVTFGANKGVFNTYALIDSGSDYTILPIEAAREFKFNLGDQPQYYLQGAGGAKFKVYKSPVATEYLIKKRGFRDFKWKSHIYFAEAMSTTLLGFKGFLENFEVKLNGKTKEIKLYQPV